MMQQIKRVDLTNDLSKQKGFGLLDSMIALLLFAGILMFILHIDLNSQKHKNARILAKQTEAFAKTYVALMRANRDNMEKILIKQGFLVLSPSNVDWPADLKKKNLYAQTPCVTIIRNPNTGNSEALMYYVGDNIKTDQMEVTRAALTYLAKIGGIIERSLDNQFFIRGGAGWFIDSNSNFIKNKCSAAPFFAVNSLAVKLDLMMEWNNNLQSIHSLSRILDKRYPPGHSQNQNTLKSNLYLGRGKGIIFDRGGNGQDELKLGIISNSNGKDVNIGIISNSNKNNEFLFADSFKPKLEKEAGTECSKNERGKIVARSIKDGLGLIAKNNLICTKNPLICETTSQFCYLPFVSNRITFRNYRLGIQNTGGRFICPKYTPFFEGAELGIGNFNDNKVPIYISGAREWGNIFSKDVYCKTANGKPDFSTCVIGFRGMMPVPEQIKNHNEPSWIATLSDSISPGNGIPITNRAGRLKLNVGYQIDPYQPINMSDFFHYISKQYPKKSCEVNKGQKVGNFKDRVTGKEYVYSWCFNGGYNQLGFNTIFAVSVDHPVLHNRVIIKQVTCSNSPVYVMD